jgi:cytochrome P450
MTALAEHPWALSRLHAGFAALAPAVEGILRWTAPGLNLSRTAARDSDLGGVRIPAGDVSPPGCRPGIGIRRSSRSPTASTSPAPGIRT